MFRGNTCAMTRGGFGKSKMYLFSSSCREAKRAAHRYMTAVSGNAAASSRKEARRELPEMEIRGTWSSNWVPDARTGIYFPKGQEQVMDGIPEGAASLNNETFWLRNVEGVLEKPDPDSSPDHYYKIMHM